MGLPTDLVFFFDPVHYVNELKAAGMKVPQSPPARTIGDFLKDRNYGYERMWEAASACRRLIDAGALTAAGRGKGSPPLCEAYWSGRFRPEKLAFPLFEFIVYGFPAIRDYYSRSVVPVLVEKKNGEHDIGTAFLIESNQIVTAAHCIEDMVNVSLRGWNSEDAPLQSIHVFKNQEVDLALLTFEKSPIPDAPGFTLGTPNVLDEIVTMGYPPIQGFEAPLVSEVAQIAATLKSSVGRVVCQAKAYLDKNDYLLLSARVKGGNSGGPVIGKFGQVLGVVNHFPADSSGRPDLLGYAAALPSSRIIELAFAARNAGERVRKVDFRQVNCGFSTSSPDCPG